MKPQIQSLCDALPSWAKLEHKQADRIDCIVSLPKNGGDTHPELHLSIFQNDQTLAAMESSQHIWPKFCPERHINPSGDFCLGVESRVPKVIDGASAKAWWTILQAYLKLQFSASRIGRWTANNAYPHGNAGNLQASIEDKISKSTLGDQIEFSELRASGLLHPEMRKKMISKSGDRLVNGRVPCIFFNKCECILKSKQKYKRKPILKRKCENRDLIFEILKCEEKIENAEKTFWRNLTNSSKHKNFKCCGFSKNCGFYNQQG